MNERQWGFSLVEMMIAMVLGTLVVAAVIGVFVLGNRNYAQDDRFARMQENGRYALKVLSGELANAGFWGGIPSPGSITSVVAGDCGVTFGGVVSALTILSKTNGATVNANYNCIPAASFKAGTDLLLVQRVESTPATASSLAAETAERLYLRTDSFNAGAIIKIDPTDSTTQSEVAASSAIPTLDATYWRYRPHIYYIQDGATPVLFRKALETSTMTKNELIADGVEQVRIFFGIDSDGDGVVNQFKANPTAAEMNSVVNARLYVLIRSPEKDPHYTDDKTYVLGDTCYNVAGDNGCTALTDAAVPSEPARYHRRVLSTTVLLRNPYYTARYGT